jgi:hypothetical protein
MELRDFLYLDRPLVRGFLAQIEGGNVDELTEREHSAGGTSLGGRLGPKIARAQGKKTNEHSIETEAVVRQVGTSEFDRLLSYLEDDDLTVLGDVEHPDEVSSLRRKQFLEVDGRVRLSGLQQVMNLISTFTSAVPMMNGLGTGVNMNEGTANSLAALSDLGKMETAVPVIVAVPGAAEFKVVLELNPSFALVDKWDVDASVLMKVQRVLKPGEKQLVGDPMGGLVKMMPEDKRAGFLQAMSSPDLQNFGVVGDAEVTFPAAIATPIAIYR